MTGVPISFLLARGQSIKVDPIIIIFIFLSFAVILLLFSTASL